MHQLTPEWFKLRRGRVTGSIAGAALELSPFLTRARAHALLRGEDDEMLETAAMARGSRLEPMALLAYQRAMGVAATPCGIFVSKTTDWLASSPDAIVVDGDNRSIGSVECKAPANGAPRPPTDGHIIQCWMHSYATGLPWTDYVSLGATHVLVARVVFEPDVFDETILPLLREFYDARTEESIGLLSPREAADLRQEMRDYRAVHLNTAPRIVEHKLKLD